MVLNKLTKDQDVDLFRIWCLSNYGPEATEPLIFKIVQKRLKLLTISVLDLEAKNENWSIWAP